ncbi:5932_t:CDS:2 [Paraglomus brasilianum]|uniref:5932_t:CDS:1 n=1 Tax=Paraglomus brasilianum TaxID=144538 RepID=A0A9N9A5D8_9GLOM|nr:5932_t:CDS:2 [Paraglomus brasilianum]
MSSRTRHRYTFIASYATEAAAGGAPVEPKIKLPAPGGSNTVDAKISKIADDISSLTLMEVSQLLQLLKTRLNIQDVAMPLPSMVAPAAPTDAGAPAAEEEKAPEKTEFKVKLEKFDPASKTKVIREMKNILPGMNLVEAKKFVESAPKVIKESANKEEAEKIKSTLEALGATVVLE